MKKFFVRKVVDLLVKNSKHLYLHFSYFSTNFYLFSKFTGFKTKLKGSFIKKAPGILPGPPGKI